MKKKWICTVCGYVHEGDEAPDFCPQCKQPKSKFKELVETTGALTFADEHVIGVAKGCDEEMIRIATRAKQLNLDAIHDTVHEMAKDEARHGKGFEGLFNRYFK